MNEDRRMVVQKYCIQRAALSGVDAILPFPYIASRGILKPRFRLEGLECEIITGIDISASAEQIDELVDTTIARLKRRAEETYQIWCYVAWWPEREGKKEIVSVRIPKPASQLSSVDIANRIQSAFSDLEG